MVHFICGKSTHSLTGMTQRALVPWHASRGRGRNMVARLAQHTEIGPGMAGGTSSRNPGMGIRQIRAPDTGAMTDFTTDGRRYVIGQFDINTGIGIDMAGSACPSRNPGVGVRRDQRQPGGLAVTGAAGQRTDRNMHRRLAGRLDAIMTADTIGIRHPVGKGCRQPGRRRLVTDIAGLGCIDMGSRFRLGIHRHVSTTVAGIAVAGGDRSGRPGMAHHTRIEGREIGMTDIAGRRRRNVR